MRWKTRHTGEDRATLLLCLGTITFEAHDTRVGRATCLRALEHAAEDDGLRARIHERLAFVAGGAVGFSEAAWHAEQAVELARRVGDTATLARALARVASQRLNCGHGFATALFEESIQLENELGGLELDYGPSAVYARALLDVGRLVESRALLEALCERGRATADAAVNLPLFVLADLELHVGRWDRAAALAHESYEVAVQTGREAAEPKGMFMLAHVEIRRGDLAAGRARAERALVLTDGRGWNSGGPRGALALLELSLENHAAAYDVLIPVVERYRSLGSCVSGEFDVAEALAGLGRVDEGRALLGPSEAEARACGILWAVAAAGRARGRSSPRRRASSPRRRRPSTRRGSRPSAREARSSSAGRCSRSGRSSDACAGSRLRAARSKRRWRSSRSSARRCGPSGRGESWRESAAGPPLPARSSRRWRSASPSLVGGGAANKEVAATLKVSPKTVEWNLSKIYRKLDVRSRGELAARVRKSRDVPGERDLTPP